MRDRIHPVPRPVSARPRVAIVATGSELVRGDRRDRNGPFFASAVLSLGLDPARITLVGDDPGELEAALREGFQADLCVVSGGLGPTHDDRTVEMVAQAAGVDLVVDEGLESEIEAISRSYAERLGRPYADFAHGVRKQATLPAGADSIGLAGTAPGFVLQTAVAAVVVLPGPRASCSGCGRGALRDRGRTRRRRSCAATLATDASPVRRQRVECRAHVARRGRRRRRCRRHGLRAGLRDPRRYARGARCREARGRPGGDVARRARAARSSQRTSVRWRRSCSAWHGRSGGRSPPPSRARWVVAERLN